MSEDAHETPAPRPAVLRESPRAHATTDAPEVDSCPGCGATLNVKPEAPVFTIRPILVTGAIAAVNSALYMHGCGTHYLFGCGWCAACCYLAIGRAWNTRRRP